MRTRPLVRAVPAGLLAVALLAACGDETSDNSSPSDTASDTAAESASPRLTSRLLGGDPLDLPESTAALLGVDNLPGFQSDGQGPLESAPPEESDGLPVCETNDTFEDRFDYARVAVTRVSQDFIFADDARLLFTTSLVSSFQNEDQAAAALDEVAAQFGECTDIEDTEDGTTVTITIEHNDDAATDDVDDQFNMTAVGNYTAVDEDPFAMGFGFSLARVDNNVTMTEVISLGVAEDRALLEPYTEIAVDRLVAVMNGETPEDVAGPGPTPVPASRLPIEPGQFSLEQFNKVAPRFGLPG